jgi:hypothetical protein
MHVPLGPEFEPGSLLGNAKAGLVLLDENGSVTLYNRQAVRLLGVTPDQALGASFSEIVGDPLVQGLLSGAEGKSSNLIVDHEGRPLDLTVTTGRMEDRLYRVVELRDGAKRRALESRTSEFEKGAIAAQSDWSSRLKATSILQFLRDTAAECADQANFWDMVRRTGVILFPAGGAVCTADADSMTPRSNWGALADLATFATQTCAAAPGVPSSRCPHFPADLAALCIAFDEGRLCLAQPETGQVDEETGGLFADTVSYGLTVVKP